MNRQNFSEQALTVVFVGVIACLFIVQAKVGLDSGGVPKFSLEHMNLAFGYDSSSSSSSSSVGVETGNCMDSFDNDSDGLIDCADSNCSGDPACVSSSSSSSSSSSIACAGTAGADQTLLYSGHCYMLFTNVDKTWTNAKAACAAYSGSYLASITASAEQNQIVSNFSFPSQSTFIGLNDRTTEGTFAWDHGETLSYTNWGSAQPDNFSGNQDCAVLYQSFSYQWDDNYCDSSYDYLCEMTVAPACGNSVKENAEACDDGDTSSGDGCSATCAVESGWSCSGTAPTICTEVCGNGIITSGEECDDGNTSNGDGCSSSCTEQEGWSCTGAPSTCATTCGDGITAGSEACDDGNMTDTDACRNSCVYATCGDGVIQPDGAEPGTADDETCDDAGESATCDDDCTAVACGDQRINEAASEQCDDGNSANTDACLNSCVTASCGDSYLRAGIETCEPPGVGTCGGSCTEARGVGTTTARAVAPVPLKGIVRDHCGNGVFEPLKGEICDLGRFNGLSPLCDRNCNATFCGDGIVQTGDEECEPDRSTDGTFTASLCGGRICTIPVCNDEGTCINGCSWVFLPACRAAEKTIVPVFQSTEVSSSSDSNEMAGIYGGFFPVFKAEDEALLPDRTDSSPAAVTSSSVTTTAAPASKSSVSSSVTVSSLGVVLQRCGNGLREGNEECDDGSARNSNILPDSCRLDCTAAKCGDRVVDFREECDDGNKISGDGCTPACTFSECGNGVLERGEECDDGALNNDTKPDSCRTRCILPNCGDGVRDASFGEQCDQGVDNSNTIADRCRLNCTMPHCEDGVKDALEQCDDGNASNFDACTNTCRAVNCGNGILDWNEACDDGNLLSGDGCSSSCLADSQSIIQWLKSAVWLPFGK